MTDATTVFWSYAHDDDKFDRGRLLLLATHLQEEYALLTGEPLRMFVDRDDLAWGNQWRETIDGALSMSSFFIPVLSPRYFKRPECRRELLDFYAQAESRGVSKLLLPLNYVSVPAFGPEHSDELVALTARTQYVDWTSLRLQDPSTTDYRLSINRLAQRLVELQEEVRQIELEAEAAGSPEEATPTGLLDALAKVDSLLPSWLAAVEKDPIKIAQHEAINLAYQRKRVRARNQQQQLALLHREATDLLPIARDALDLATIYSASTIDLHPHVTSLLRAVRVAPDFSDVLGPLMEAVSEAKLAIDGSELQPGQMKSADAWRERAHLGRTFRDLAETHEKSEKLRSEANEIVLSWHDQLVPLAGRSAGARESASEQSATLDSN
ncbi:toll/interleukin-1 receptor domain-containing protein [Plantibacter sp. CFBP 8798]|uniref:toll/interleukin-1 receptor domain-containing protein n=1 Tax=Plantibacter sp. CFBP 8798 TaxID=2775268 RepID=UPI00178585C5|nr:toll/interleukin-1 receptor domain-containing protein [Plantibacter sp. CFBP 8798]MBD8468206.1 toll/interleukin-1 receptor domain-containing protein [Plantibacter sp. CFBP 8798]